MLVGNTYNSIPAFLSPEKGDGLGKPNPLVLYGLFCVFLEVDAMIWNLSKHERFLERKEQNSRPELVSLWREMPTGRGLYVVRDLVHSIFLDFLGTTCRLKPTLREGHLVLFFYKKTDTS